MSWQHKPAQPSSCQQQQHPHQHCPAQPASLPVSQPGLQLALCLFRDNSQKGLQRTGLAQWLQGADRALWCSGGEMEHGGCLCLAQLAGKALHQHKAVWFAQRAGISGVPPLTEGFWTWTRVGEWPVLEGTLMIIFFQPLMWTAAPSTGPDCSELYPTQC